MRRSYLVSVIAAILVAGGLFSAPGAALSRATVPEHAVSGSALAARDAGTEPVPRVRKVLPADLNATPWVEGEILVQFKKGVRRSEARAFHAARGARLVKRIPGFGGIDVVRLPEGASVPAAVASYRRDPRVSVAEPNLVREYDGHITGTPPTPTDALFTSQWALNNTGQLHPLADDTSGAGTPDADINAPEAWAIEQGDTTPTIIGLVDSGLDTTHPEFSGQLWVNPVESAGTPGFDDDANGCVDDINGCNFGPGSDSNLSDPVPHGTHVGGTIAANANAGDVVGVCPHCQIMVLKMGLVPTLAAELAAYDYARAMGANVINGSFGGPVWSNLERKGVKQLGNAGILAVFAAGNEALDNDMFLIGPGAFSSSPSFPASYNLSNILAVAATNHNDEYGYSTHCATLFPRAGCAFTNFGHDSVDVGAPGVDILSTLPGTLGTANGTSMATPHAAGVAGLLKAAFPARSPVEIKNAIMNSADRVPALGTAWSPIFKGGKATGKFTRTSGRLDAADALAETDLSAAWAGTGFEAATPKTDGNIDGAKSIAQVRKGRVAYPHDINDVYKKRLRKGKRYEVRLVVPRGKDYDLWAWKAKTKEIWQFDTACVMALRSCKLLDASTKGKSKDEVITFRAKSGGVHYFHVEAWVKNAGSYKLTVKRI